MGKASRTKRERQEAEARHEARLESDPKYAEFCQSIRDEALRQVRAQRLADAI
jgi:hypothetical protein